jgi:hypothetical protein
MARPSNNIQEILKNVDLFTNVSPSQAEIVITRFNEALEWTKDIAHLCTVYNKGSEPLPSYFFNKVIPTPNHGYGIETILRHIIVNYDTLALTTFFCQGALVDRTDQPLYPLEWYLLNQSPTDFKGFEETLSESPNFRLIEKVKRNELYQTVDGRTLEKFRKEVVGITYRQGVDKWVKGDWFSIGRDRIRAKSLEYYMGVYMRCQFQRGVIVEEIWLLERCYHSMFNRPIDPFFKFIPPADKQKELLEYLRGAPDPV